MLITVDSVRQKPHIYSLHNLYLLICPWQYAQLLDVEQAGLDLSNMDVCNEWRMPYLEQVCLKRTIIL